MSVEVAPGVFALTSPFPDEPRMSVNAYVLEGPDSWILLDTGWNVAEARALLDEHLTMRRANWSVVDLVLVTHLHPDHFGLMSLMRERSNSSLAYHVLESRLAQPRFERIAEWRGQMLAWDRLNGWPEEEVALSSAARSSQDYLTAPPPDRELVGGETFENGRHRLRAIWTPGHTPGHLCFLEEREGLLFTGDHLLPTISPNVPLQVQSLGNPLADFMDSLRLIRNLPARRVLPGHGEASDQLVQRVDELIQHHEERLDEIETAFGPSADQALTGYEIAARVTWTRRHVPLDSLKAFHRRLALGETLAHLEFLRGQGRVRRHPRPGRAVYTRAD